MQMRKGGSRRFLEEASTGVDEEMEVVEEGEEDSISNVKMDAGQGTFITTLGLLRGEREGTDSGVS
jgi:hypothetical protein